MSCEQKMSFDTEKEAQDTALVAQHQYGNNLKAYTCQKCDLWHLSSDFGDEDDT